MRAVGIDLGTTYSVIATVRDGTPEILEGESGRLTPSVVLFDDGEPLVGSVAKNMAALRPDDYVAFVKRQMGGGKPAFIDGEDREYLPEDVSAFILRHLAAAAGQALGEEIRDVVVTVPAYFDDAARVATKDAAEIAGLNVLRLINEPTAAGIAYGLAKNASGTFLVYDLGGGTFDVTVMKVTDGGIDVIATEGNRALGGFDFDNHLMRIVADAVAADGGPDLFDDGRLETRLRLDCEEAKRRLSQLDKTVVRTAADDRLFQTTVTRADFEAATAPLLKRTEDVIDEVLDAAGLTWAGIDRVLLIGGSSRMPMVASMVERMSGTRPRIDVNPDEAVAIGAAHLAATIVAEGAPDGADTTLVRDVTSHGMGVVIQDDNEVLRNSIIISRNTTIPCEVVAEYETVCPDQRLLHMRVTEGDSGELDDVEVHEGGMLDLPPGLPDKAPLRVTMAYDVDGTIHVHVFDVTNRRPLGEIHLPRPKNLSAKAKEEKKRHLLGMKGVA